jgi:hypothetical protein
MLANLRIQDDAGELQDIFTDASWRSAKHVVDTPPNWTALDDKDWIAPMKLGPNGSAPWGTFAAPDICGPFATGVPAKVRIIYVPNWTAVRVQQLDQRTETIALRLSIRQVVH